MDPSGRSYKEERQGPGPVQFEMEHEHAGLGSRIKETLHKISYQIRGTE